MADQGWLTDTDRLILCERRVALLRVDLAAANERMARLRAGLENISVNVNGLAGGMVPGMSQDAIWYFQNIKAVCDAALAEVPDATAATEE